MGSQIEHLPRWCTTDHIQVYLIILLFAYFTEGNAAAVKGSEENIMGVEGNDKNQDRIYGMLKENHDGIYGMLKEKESDSDFPEIFHQGFDIREVKKKREGEIPITENEESLQDEEISSTVEGTGGDTNHLAMEVSVNETGVTMTVKGKMVYSCLNKTMPWNMKSMKLCQGIHLMTLNQVTGHVMRADLYMTWQIRREVQLVAALNEIEDGRLLVFIGMPDFSSQLRPETMDVFSDLGAHYAEVLATNERWCFVVYKGGRTVLENVIIDSMTSNNSIEASPLHLHFTVSRMEGQQCEWYGQVGQKEKEIFCKTYSGYGDFCSCHDVPWNPKRMSDSDFPIKEVIPVAIITARRLPHVLRQVGQIWNSPGGSKTPIVFFVDGKNSEAQALGKLLNISVVEHDNLMELGSTKRVSNHVKFSLLEVFLHHPHVDKAIILEDDLDLAPDFISYFHQTAPLLNSDKKLLCVNAYNYNAFNHTAFDPARLYRTHGIPSCGWMVNRETAYEMIKKWSFANQSMDWDLWLRYYMMKERDIIIPEIPRTKHRGGGGVHVSGLEQFIYFDQRPINKIANVTIDVKSAEAKTYLQFHYDAIRTAKVLRFTNHPCKANPIPNYKVNKTYVMYVHQPDESNSSQAFSVACRCFGLHDRGLHENLLMMVTVPFFENQLYVVGCPNSPFCLTKDPAHIYYATPEDVQYADKHPFRKVDITTYYSRRVPPQSFMEVMTLMNVNQYTINMKMEQ